MINDKEYIKRLTDVIRQYENVSIVGIKGFYETRKSKDNVLRVYMNGGCILEICLNKRKYYYADSYIKSDKYFTDGEKHELNRIIGIVDKQKEWKEKNDDFALLKKYLDILSAGTDKKFNKKQSENKERSKQTLLYSRNRKIGPLYLFDFEFQSSLFMNYLDINEANEWLKKHSDRKKPHRGKPDYVAFDKDGFVLMELKTNKKALSGNAGVEEHNDDIDKMIKVNAHNHYLVKELKERLKVSLECDLISEGTSVAKKLLKKEDEDILIKKKFIFLTSKELPREFCEKYVKDKGIKDALIVDLK